MSTETKIDPELVDDRGADLEIDTDTVDLPEFDPTLFELPDDFEYSDEEDGDENAD